MLSSKQIKKSKREMIVDKIKRARTKFSKAGSGPKVYTVLEEKDAYLVARLLTDPPEPNEVLRRAAKAHSRLLE